MGAGGRGGGRLILDPHIVQNKSFVVGIAPHLVHAFIAGGGTTAPTPPSTLAGTPPTFSVFSLSLLLFASISSACFRSSSLLSSAFFLSSSFRFASRSCSSFPLQLFSSCGGPTSGSFDLPPLLTTSLCKSPLLSLCSKSANGFPAANAWSSGNTTPSSVTLSPSSCASSSGSTSGSKSVKSSIIAIFKVKM